jgi:nucleoside-diphosphate-sugar epimerase
MIKKSDPIFLAGHKGLIGSAIHRRLSFYGYKNIITINLMPQGPLAKLVRRVQFPILSEFKQPGPCSRNNRTIKQQTRPIHICLPRLEKLQPV